MFWERVRCTWQQSAEENPGGELMQLAGCDRRGLAACVVSEGLTEWAGLAGRLVWSGLAWPCVCAG